MSMEALVAKKLNREKNYCQIKYLNLHPVNLE